MRLWHITAVAAYVAASILAIAALVALEPRSMPLERCRQQEPAPPAALCARVDTLEMA